MDSNQVKWYSILASFAIALVESVLILFLLHFAFGADASLLLEYADIFVPILFFVNIRTSKKLGSKIVYDQQPPFKTAKGKLANTMFVSHILAINAFLLYLFINKSAWSIFLEDFSRIAWGFLAITLGCCIIIPIICSLPNQLFGYILGKIIDRFKP